MPFPSKTGREAILTAAVERLERGEIQAVSLRSLAAELGIAPNALYRYFADRSQLEAAISAECARRLYAALRAAAGKAKPPRAIRNVAKAYLGFARQHRWLYETLVMPCPLTEESAHAHGELWLFVVELVGRLAGPKKAPEAAVALWAFLHGMASLEAAEVFSSGKPLSSFDFGIKAWAAAALASEAGQV